MAWVAIGVGVVAAGVSAYSSSENAKAQIEAQENASEEARENARRRYELKSGVSKNQMEEQKNLALEKMTDITRETLKVKATQKVAQIESGVTGNLAKRKESLLRLKSSEAKGKVAKETDTNNINIARGMLAEKIDTEALIREANLRESSTANIALNTLSSAVQGFSQGFSVANSFSSKLDVSSSSVKGTARTGQPYSTKTSNNLWGL